MQWFWCSKAAITNINSLAFAMPKSLASPVLWGVDVPIGNTSAMVPGDSSRQVRLLGDASAIAGVLASSTTIIERLAVIALISQCLPTTFIGALSPLDCTSLALEVYSISEESPNKPNSSRGFTFSRLTMSSSIG